MSQKKSNKANYVHIIFPVWKGVFLDGEKALSHSVGKLVPLQITWHSKSLVALVANKLLFSVNLCVFRWPDWEKDLLHSEQTKRFFLVWESMCFFRSPDRAKVLSHWLHAPCFAPVWETWCVFRWPECENFFFALSTNILPFPWVQEL